MEFNVICSQDVLVNGRGYQSVPVDALAMVVGVNKKGKYGKGASLTRIESIHCMQKCGTGVISQSMSTIVMRSTDEESAGGGT